MRTTTSPFALLALPALAYAVVLNDFTPRVSDLPPACDKVYNQQVAGCKPTDFPTCSEACVRGLAAMTQPVQSACGNAKISGQNIITAFLSGSGPSALCTNAGTYLSGSGSGSDSSSAKAPSSSPSPPASTKSTPPATSATSSSAAATTTTRTETEESSSASSVASTSSSSSEPSSSTAAVDSTTSAIATPSSTAIVMDTSSSPAPTSTRSSSDSEQTAGNDHSGGGSPFDTAGNLRDTSAATTSLPAWSLTFLAAMAALYLPW